MLWRRLFKSKPNRCSGCPLEDEADWVDRVLHRCGSRSAAFSVSYRLDDLGRTVCIVKRRALPQKGDPKWEHQDGFLP